MGTIAQRFETGEQSADKGLFMNLVMLARVDGKVDEEEKQLLERIAHRLSLTDEQVEEIKMHPENYPMVPPVSLEDRLERFAVFIEVMLVDGVIAMEEEQLLEKYGLALGFKEEEAIQNAGFIITQINEGKDRSDIVDMML